MCKGEFLKWKPLGKKKKRQYHERMRMEGCIICIHGNSTMKPIDLKGREGGEG
jgi:hypothetical protein